MTLEFGSGSGRGSEVDVELLDIFTLAQIQNLQDRFSEATHVASIITAPDGTPITEPSNFCRLCSQLIRATETGRYACRHSDSVLGSPNPEGPTVRTCLSGGLWDAGASIVIGGRHVANWLIGQVRNDQADRAALAVFAREIGVDEAEFFSAYEEVPVMSDDEFHRIADFLHLMAGQLSSSAYHNVRQARLIAQCEETERTLDRTTRALRALNGVNEALVRASSEEGLLESVCDAIVESNGYAVAWVGYVSAGVPDTIVPIQVSGDVLCHLGLPGSGREYVMSEQGPLRRCLNTLRPVIVRNAATDPVLASISEVFSTNGVNTLGVFPLIDESEGTALGALLIHSHDVQAFDREEADLLSRMVADLSYGICSLRERACRARAEQELRGANRRLEGIMKCITRTMGCIVEMRDPYTQGHEVVVAALSRLLAEEMGLSADDVEAVEIAALVHDIGKLNVPVEILTKPGTLSDVEVGFIREHPRAGYEILRHIDFGWPVAEMVLQHHERLDGSGYPRGLRNGEIMLGARIVAVADVVEAMASHRPYRPALGIDAAIDEIIGHPEQYDQAVVAALLSLYRRGKLQVGSDVAEGIRAGHMIDFDKLVFAEPVPGPF